MFIKFMNAKLVHSNFTMLYFLLNFTCASTLARSLESTNLKEESEPEDSSHLQLYLVCLAVIMAIVLIVSSVYYRRHLDYYGFPPFEVPTFAPKFIFPRPSVDPFLRNTVDRNLELIFRRDSL